MVDQLVQKMHLMLVANQHCDMVSGTGGAALMLSASNIANRSKILVKSMQILRQILMDGLEQLVINSRAPRSVIQKSKNAFQI